MTTTAMNQRRLRRLAGVMALEAATLAAMALLHLSGSLGGGLTSFSAPAAGIAEAVICVVLTYGASRLIRGGPRARAAAIASTTFAIAGFAIGLSATVGGGDALDIAYHVTMLPLLVLTLWALLRRAPRAENTRVNHLKRSLT
jgi:hypothetical protein